ncbi:putative bifunctional diguanylate cyclase/phosphodiesterase [Paraferrimonas sedimenticola]|uniref:putative bifunctional diguanylate cyclase/phosphodiesterase n=1 Tax=Paraferrimonas sedimenticola TaxID=375674 RepID=UPI001140CD14|nr:EAL domain-containing protein [Paraferrimonas sedimenticola]
MKQNMALFTAGHHAIYTQAVERLKNVANMMVQSRELTESVERLADKSSNPTQLGIVYQLLERHHALKPEIDEIAIYSNTAQKMVSTNSAKSPNTPAELEKNALVQRYIDFLESTPNVLGTARPMEQGDELIVLMAFSPYQLPEYEFQTTHPYYVLWLSFPSPKARRFKTLSNIYASFRAEHLWKLGGEFPKLEKEEGRHTVHNIIEDSYRLKTYLDLDAEVNYIMAPKLWWMGLVVLFCAFFSIAILKYLIARKVLSPIQKLVKSIRNKDSISELKVQTDGTEIATLNNAYIDMLTHTQTLANCDPLTGLANRRAFNEYLRESIALASENDSQLGLLYIDLDNFKQVNDNYGHASGDRLLAQFSKLLEQSLKQSCLNPKIAAKGTARLAGDEFAILVEDIRDFALIMQLAQQVLAMFKDGFGVDGIAHNVQASIGIACYPLHAQDASKLLHYADAAMYRAKNQGKNRVQLFNQDIADTLDRRQLIEQKLNHTLALQTFELAYMPILNTQTQRIEAVEVLLRCPHLSAEGIGPDEFIPVAESTGLIRMIDLNVIEQALERLVYYQREFGYQGRFCINISASQLSNDLFAANVGSLIYRFGVDPSKVEIEITETSMVDSSQKSMELLGQLKNLGVRLSLDDYGTGYTAFNQLLDYPVDCLKIDRSFVNELGKGDGERPPVVDIILALARWKQLEVVAEGVETQEQFQYLRQTECQMVQGFYFSKPLNQESFEAYLTEQVSLGKALAS